MTVSRLSIGGFRPGPGWVNVDPYDQRAGVVRRPIWDTGLSAMAFDWIEAIHVLEHCPQAMVVPALQEVRRLLHPSGLAAIMVPDVREAMRRFIASPCFPPPAAIYGSQTHDGQFHKTAFVPATLAKVVRAADLHLQALEVVGDGTDGRGDRREVVWGTPSERFLSATAGIRAGVLAECWRARG